MLPYQWDVRQVVRRVRVVCEYPPLSKIRFSQSLNDKVHRAFSCPSLSFFFWPLFSPRRVFFFRHPEIQRDENAWVTRFHKNIYPQTWKIINDEKFFIPCRRKLWSGRNHGERVACKNECAGVVPRTCRPECAGVNLWHLSGSKSPYSDIALLRLSKKKYKQFNNEFRWTLIFFK